MMTAAMWLIHDDVDVGDDVDGDGDGGGDDGDDNDDGHDQQHGDNDSEDVSEHREHNNDDNDVDDEHADRPTSSLCSSLFLTCQVHGISIDFISVFLLLQCHCQLPRHVAGPSLYRQGLKASLGPNQVADRTSDQI